MESISYGVKDLSRYTGTVGHGYVSVNLGSGSFSIHGGLAPSTTTADFVRAIFDPSVGVTGLLDYSGAYLAGVDVAALQDVVSCLPDDVARDASIAASRCCTSRVRDSPREASVIAGRHEQLDPDEVQDHELADLQ